MAAPATTPELREAMRDLARGAGAAAFVGLFVNLMHLALPLYTNQIYDRVISSGSMDTLMALTLDRRHRARLPGGARLPAPPHLRDPRRAGGGAAGAPGVRGGGGDDAAARGGAGERGDPRPRRPAGLHRRRRHRAADGHPGDAALPRRPLPAASALRPDRARRRGAAAPDRHRDRGGGAPANGAGDAGRTATSTPRRRRRSAMPR